MKIYFAGSESVNHRENLYKSDVRNVLFSFYSVKRNVETFLDFEKKFSNIFIDSGGFSARIKGISIDVKEYADYLRKIINLNTKKVIYANLDLKETKDTLYNQSFLESYGLNPLPVYHANELFNGDKKLYFYYLEKYKYIAIGGIAASHYSKEKIKYYLDFIFKNKKDYHKIHGFGINSFQLLLKYPFYSIDSTTWIKGGQFRKIFKFKDGKIKGFDKKEQKISLEKLQCIKENYMNLNLVNIKTTLNIEKYLTKLWKIRGIEYDS